MPVWDTLPIKEKYARMARQGYGFITGLPIRVIKTEQPEGVLIDVAKDGEEIGEIVFFGNICAKEYFNDANATRKLFAGGGLHSGDLAVWHPDGSIQIMDRQKDIIISGTSPYTLFTLPNDNFLQKVAKISLPSRSNRCLSNIPKSLKQASYLSPILIGEKDLKHSSR